MDRDILRIVDANFNRAREAFRVMEEAARFSLNDRIISSLAKKGRHLLTQCILEYLPDDLLTTRDITGDVGTNVTTSQEESRPCSLSVVQAAAKRLSEALRCLEEYGKTIDPNLGRQLEEIRYQGYDLEKRLITRLSGRDSFAKVRLYVLLTENLCRLSLMETARQVLEAGAQCLQLREKDKTDDDLLTIASELCDLCHEFGAMFILNDRPDIAELANADGIHLGQTDLPVAQVRKVMLSRRVVGKSSHTLEEAESAVGEDIDYLAAGSIYGSPTKPEVFRAGLALIKGAKELCDIPIIAIGGIQSGNVREVVDAGATGVAVCQTIISLPDPGEATRGFIKQFSKNIHT